MMSAVVTTFWQQSHFQAEIHKRKAFDAEGEMRKKACQESVWKTVPARVPDIIPSRVQEGVQDRVQDRVQITKRLAEVSLNEQLMKRVRCSQPRYKSAKASEAFSQNQKLTYTKQEVEQLLKHMNDTHRAELDEQYATFQTIVNDFIQCSDRSKGAPSYIS